MNCTLPPVGIILVLSYFMHSAEYDRGETGSAKDVDVFSVLGVILGAVVANLLPVGIASINGMVVAAVCYLLGEGTRKKK